MSKNEVNSKSRSKLAVNASTASNEEQSKHTKDNVRYWFEKIESIKSTISMTNGDRPELWIQRQNLQDLYRKIILSDIDFTIDKKLEQDLWNYVFKIQINYFQGQIKENNPGLSGGSQNTTGVGSGNKIALPQKKLEAQANLSFFLEASRGFYTKLLEDLILAYDLNDKNSFVSFCQPFTSFFEKINSLNSKTSANRPEIDAAKEKQILYICQHILTHLGDIARYANQFQQAKNYYLHAIRLVPYLGHPYNQLGILFETSRTNQLSTVFFYIRSIAVRYTFPLASANLENFFQKLIEIPLTRYNPSNLAIDLVKLSHKDLLTLYLQINAIVYFSMLNKQQRLLNSTNASNTKLVSLIDLFKMSFDLFMKTPIQRDKLDSAQLCQVVSILIFILSMPKATNAKGNSNDSYEHALDLFSFLFEKFVSFYNSEELGDFVLPSIYVMLGFIEGFTAQLNLITTNKLWSTKSYSNEIKAATFCHSIVAMLNKISREKTKAVELSESFNLEKYADYPLNEDKMLDSFLPLKNIQEKISFRIYMKNLDTLNEAEENSVRKYRILRIFQHILQSESVDCFVKFADSKFMISSKCPILLSDEKKASPTKDQLLDVKSPQKTDEKTSLPSTPSSVEAPFRKKRQNVAISSITNSINQASTNSNNSVTKTNINSKPIETNNHIKTLSNQSNNKLAFINTSSSSSSSPSPLTLSSSSSISNSTNLLTSDMNTKRLENIMMKNQQSNFFPSASRQFQQQANNYTHTNDYFPKSLTSLNQTYQTNSTNSSLGGINNDFPSFLPTDQLTNSNKSNNLFEFNPREQINQLNKKLELQQHRFDPNLPSKGSDNLNFLNKLKLSSEPAEKKSSQWPNDSLSVNNSNSLDTVDFNQLNLLNVLKRDQMSNLNDDHISLQSIWSSLPPLPSEVPLSNNQTQSIDNSSIMSNLLLQQLLMNSQSLNSNSEADNNSNQLISSFNFSNQSQHSNSFANGSSLVETSSLGFPNPLNNVKLDSTTRNFPAYQSSFNNKNNL